MSSNLSHSSMSIGDLPSKSLLRSCTVGDNTAVAATIAILATPVIPATAAMSSQTRINEKRHNEDGDAAACQSDLKRRKRNKQVWNVSDLNGYAFAFLEIEDVARLMSVCKNWSLDVLAMPRNAVKYYMNVNTVDAFAHQTSSRVSKHFHVVVRLYPGTAVNALQELLVECRKLPNLYAIELTLRHWFHAEKYVIDVIELVDMAHLQIMDVFFDRNDAQETVLPSLIQLAGNCTTLRTLVLHAGPQNVEDLDFTSLRFHPTLTEMDLKHVHVSPTMAEHLLTISNLQTVKIAHPFKDDGQPRLSTEVATILARHPGLGCIDDLLTLEGHITSMRDCSPLAPLKMLSVSRKKHPSPASFSQLLVPWKQTLTELSLNASEDICRDLVASDFQIVAECSNLTSLTLTRLDCDQVLVDLLALNLKHLRSLHLERGSLGGPLSFNGFAQLMTLGLCAMEYDTPLDPDHPEVLGTATKDALIEMLTSNPRITELDISGSFYKQGFKPWGQESSQGMDEFAVHELGIPCARLPRLRKLYFEFVCEW